MRDYDPYKDDWKNEVGHAVARFIINVTTMVPLIGAAIALGLFIHYLLSEPFGFSCRSIATEQSVMTSKHRIAPSRVIPIAPTFSPQLDKDLPIAPLKSDAIQE